MLLLVKKPLKIMAIYINLSTFHTLSVASTPSLLAAEEAAENCCGAWSWRGGSNHLRLGKQMRPTLQGNTRDALDLCSETWEALGA